MTVRRLLEDMGSAELTEWQAFDSLDPIGEQRADLRAGIVAAVVANHSMHAPKTPVRPVDFMPFADGRKPAGGGPVLLKDPVAHGRLIASSLFGKRIQ